MPILAPRVGVARLFKRVLLLISSAYTRPDGLVAYLQRHDIEVVPVDNAPVLGNKAHDIRIDSFYSDLLFRAQRGEFLAVRAAPPCSIFSIARFQRVHGTRSRRRTTGRTVSIGGPSVRLPQQSGEEPQRGAQVERADSTHNQRTINILRAAHNAGSEFGMEYPADHGDTV